MMGPFVFGAAGAGDSTTDTVDTSGGEIAVTNNDDWGYIIGLGTNWAVNPAAC